MTDRTLSAKSRRRRLWHRATVTAGVICLVAGIATFAWPSGAHADSSAGSGLGSFGISATAPGGQFTYSYPGATPDPQAEGEVPESVAQLASGPHGYALSSLAWPGPLVANAGATAELINLGLPTSVSQDLNDPIRAEARTGSGPPTVTNNAYPGVSMTATATDANVSADAALSGVNGPAPQSGSGNTETHSTAAVTGPSTVTGTAYSLVQAVHLAGGVVTFQSVTSKVTASASPVSSEASGSTVVSGLTVGGEPAYIDQSGLHLGSSGPGVPVNPIASSLASQALAGAGMKVAVGQPQTQHSGNQLTYTTGTVVFYWAPPGDSHGDDFTATFGGASVTVSASQGFSGAALTFGSPTAYSGGTLASTGSAATSTTPAVAAPNALPGGPSTPVPASSGGTSTALPKGTVSASQGPSADTTTGSGSGGGSPARLGDLSMALTHGISPIAPILVLLGSILTAAALRRLPDRVLDKAADACIIGEGQ